MRQRCSNPKNPNWDRYGGRGITVCDAWQSFDRFLADMGPRPDGFTLERIDNDRGYEPGNVRWASRWEQGQNRAHTPRFDVDGRRLTLSEILREFPNPLDLKRSTLQARLEGGMPLHVALREPVNPRFNWTLDDREREAATRVFDSLPRASQGVA